MNATSALAKSIFDMTPSCFYLSKTQLKFGDVIQLRGRQSANACPVRKHVPDQDIKQQKLYQYNSEISQLGGSSPVKDVCHSPVGRRLNAAIGLVLILLQMPLDPFQTSLVDDVVLLSIS